MSTIAWARDVTDERPLLSSLRQLARCGYPVAIADRGTRSDFTDALRHIEGCQVIVPSHEGLVAQVKASVSLAAGFMSRYLLYVEPDKKEFFARRMVDFVRQAPDVSDIGIVLASRSTRSFKTFPPIQQRTEAVFNTLCADVLGSAGDYAYGPFLMHRALVPHVLSVNASLGWGWRPSTFVASKRQGLRVVHAVGDHPCPASQRKEDAADGSHRRRQLSENIRGLLDDDLLERPRT